MVLEFGDGLSKGLLDTLVAEPYILANRTRKVCTPLQLVLLRYGVLIIHGVQSLIIYYLSKSKGGQGQAVHSHNFQGNCTPINTIANSVPYTKY